MPIFSLACPVLLLHIKQPHSHRASCGGWWKLVSCADLEILICRLLKKMASNGDPERIQSSLCQHHRAITKCILVCMYVVPPHDSTPMHAICYRMTSHVRHVITLLSKLLVISFTISSVQCKWTCPDSSLFLESPLF